jgi:6-pyruvoyltetrahydropterin/6-carboxytetrahydropterin synthase
MFTVGISDHVMVAHSLAHPGFGPAQRVHGATFVVEVELLSPELDDMACVADISRMRRELRAVLDPMDYRNLDELPEWQGKLSTTEALCRHIHRAMSARLADVAHGHLLKVRLHENPSAWAAYEAPL